MDEIVIVDCETGEAIRREMNPEEQAQRQADIAEHERVMTARAEQTAGHHEVLSAVAASAGVSVDDLKAALGHVS